MTESPVRRYFRELRKDMEFLEQSLYLVRMENVILSQRLAELEKEKSKS